MRLSEKWGVNPSVTRCFYCGEDCGIAMFGADGFRKKDEYGHLVSAEAPHCIGVINMVPCSKCRGYMKMGIIIISMRDGEGDRIVEQQLDWRARRDAMSEQERKTYLRPFMPDVYRTGLWTVVRDDAPMFEEGFIKPEELRRNILERRWLFLENDAVVKLGLGDAAGMELVDGAWRRKDKQGEENAEEEHETCQQAGHIHRV